MVGHTGGRTPRCTDTGDGQILNHVTTFSNTIMQKVKNGTSRYSIH